MPARLTLGRPAGAAWTAALAAVTVAVLVLRLIGLAGYVQRYQWFGDSSGAERAGVESALLALLAVTLVLATRRAMADPPPVPSEGVPARR